MLNIAVGVSISSWEFRGSLSAIAAYTRICLRLTITRCYVFPRLPIGGFKKRGMKRLFLVSVSASIVLLLSCGKGGEPTPEYNATGLWEILRAFVNVPGVSWDSDTASLYSRGKHFFLFDDDGSYRWLECKDDECAIRETGIFSVGHDTLWIDASFTGRKFFLMERGTATDAMFLHAPADDDRIPMRYAPRSVLQLNEIRDVRSLKASSLGTYGSMAHIPASRLSPFPNAIAFEMLVGLYETSGDADTVRYDCLWDIRADSTIVEYLSRGDVRRRRTYRFHVKWDPEDYCDTITLMARNATVRRLQYLGSKHGGADMRRKEPYEWYRFYDLRNKNSSFRWLANELLSYNDYVDE